jgi:membrane protease YdiL (CAAX protease family)
MTKSFRQLLERVRAPEANLPPWEFPLGVMLGIAYLLSIFGATLIVATMMDADVEALEPKVLAYSHLLACILILVLVFQYITTSLARAEANQTPAEAIRFVPSINTPYWIISFYAFAVAILTDTVGLAIGVSLESLPVPLERLSTDDVIPFFAAATVVVILRPIAEEVILRGVLYTGLLHQMSAVPAIVLTALASTAIHFLFDAEYVWWGVVQPFVIGMTAGIIRAATQSTQMAILAHAMFGVFVVLRAGLA